MSQRMLAFAEQAALIRRGKETAAEQVEPSRRHQSAFQYHEAGQVFGFAAQSVEYPATHARPALKAGA